MGLQYARVQLENWQRIAWQAARFCNVLCEDEASRCCAELGRLTPPLGSLVLDYFGRKQLTYARYVRAES
jgi:hypothetical protein